MSYSAGDTSTKEAEKTTKKLEKTNTKLEEKVKDARGELKDARGELKATTSAVTRAAAVTAVAAENLHQLHTVSAVQHVIASIIIYILLGAVCIIPALVWIALGGTGSAGTQAALIMFGIFVLTFGAYEVMSHKELLASI